MKLFVVLAWSYFFFPIGSWAQDGLSPESMVSLIRSARSPIITLNNKEIIAEKSAQYIQHKIKENPNLKGKTDEEIKAFFINRPDALWELGIDKKDPIVRVITEYSQLLATIEATKTLNQCQTDQKPFLDNIINKATDAYSACDTGKYSHKFIVWENEDKESQSTIPAFLYFEQAFDLNALTNIANRAALKVSQDPSVQLGESLEKIKAANPDMSEEELNWVAKAIELRREAYVRASTNSLKTIAMLRVLYSRPNMEVESIQSGLKWEVDKYCKNCSTDQKSKMLKEVEASVKRDISENNKSPLSELQITKAICGKLISKGYNAEEAIKAKPYVSDKKLETTWDAKDSKFVVDTVANENPGLVTDPVFHGSSPEQGIRQAEVEKKAILSSIGEGWESLLLMTPELTGKNDKDEPAYIRLDCFNQDNPKNTELIKSAVARADLSAQSYLQEMNDSVNFTQLSTKDVKDDLAVFIRENPRSVGEALIAHPEHSKIVCGVTANKIEIEEEAKHNRSLAYTWGAFVVGAALETTGFLAPAGAWLQGTIAVAQIGIALMVANEFSKEAAALKEEANRELLSSFGAGGEGTLYSSSLQKNQKARSLQKASNLTLALAPLSLLRPGVLTTSLKTDLASFASKTKVSAQEILKMPKSEQLRAIKKLGDLKLNGNVQLIMSADEFTKLGMKPVDELTSIVHSSKDLKIQRAAFEALKKYRKSVAGIEVLEAKISPAMVSIYSNLDLPDDIRKLALDERNLAPQNLLHPIQFKSAKTWKAEIKAEVEEHNQKLKFVEENKDENLHKYNAANADAKKVIGKDVSTFIQKNNYSKIDLANKTEPIIGMEVIVDYKIQGQDLTFMIKGKVVDEYPAGLDVEDVNGVTHRISLHHGVIKDIFIKKLDVEAFNLAKSQTYAFVEVKAPVSGSLSGLIKPSGLDKLVHEDVMVKYSLKGTDEVVVFEGKIMKEEADGLVIQELNGKIHKIDSNNAYDVQVLINLQAVNKERALFEYKSYLTEMMVSSSKEELLSGIKKAGDLKLNPKFQAFLSRDQYNELAMKPVYELSAVIAKSKDLEIQKAAFEALSKYSRQGQADDIIQRNMAEYFTEIHHNTDLPDEIRKLALSEINYFKR